MTNRGDSGQHLEEKGFAYLDWTEPLAKKISNKEIVLLRF